MQTAEQSYLEERKKARSNQDSIVEQPENTEAVDVSEDAPIEEVTDLNENVTPIIEELAEEITEVETPSEERELLYYDIDGEEVDSDQLSEWKANGLMQADYTRKTQELSESRKTFEEEVEAFKDKQSKFDTHIETLEAMVSEGNLSAEDLAELREYEPEKYIEYTEKRNKRKSFIDANKTAAKSAIGFDVETERKKLWDANPTWLDNGKQTKAFNTDMKSIQDYAAANGYTNDDFANFRAQDFQTMLSASRFESLNTKNAAIAKKVRKAPVTTKPRAQANNSIQSEIDTVQKRYNKTGNDKDFLLLRRLNRQLK